MKKLFLTVAIMLMLVPVAQATDMKIELHHNMYSDEHLDSGWGAELKVGTDNLETYLFLSCDIGDLKWGAQPWGVINIAGIGAGITREISNGLSWYGELGWFHPFVEHAPSEREAINNYVVDRYSYASTKSGTYYKFKWPDHDFKMQGNFGGKIGVDYTRNLFWNVDLNIGVAYRFLALRIATEISDPETLDREPDSQLCWGEDLSFNGWQIGVGISGTF